MKMQNELIGKHLLIGLTYVNGNDEVVEQVQAHGNIVAINENTIVVLREDTGNEFSIPYDEDAFLPADPGEYSLRGSGEIVVNPDFISTWTIHSEDIEESSS